MSLLTPPHIPSVEELNLEVLTLEEQLRQQKVVALRDYYDGAQGAQVTERLREFMPSLAKGFEFKINVVSTIIQAITEHLNVKAWDSKNATLSDWAEDVWEANEMEAKQDDVHENVLVDGEYFVLVSWSEEKGMAEWTPTRAYTSPEVGGDGYGCRMVYTQNDVNQPALYAIKRWSETDARGHIVEYKTVYYADRIEKYFRDGTLEWLRRPSPDGEWPTPWVDENGEPLGIPVIHFTNKSEESEIEDVLAIQDAVNKSAIDTLISSDLTAFRIYIALGWIPTTDGQPPKEDGSNWASIEPGKLYGTTRNKSEADFKAIEPPEETVNGLSTLTQQFIIWGALTTGTPVNRVITTKLIASDETLKQQEKPLENKVALRRALFGSKWKSCMNLSRKLHNLYSDEGELDLKEKIKPVWGSRIHTDKEELSALESKQRLGIPQEQLWLEMGYSQAKVAQFAQSKADKLKQEQEIADANTE